MAPGTIGVTPVPLSFGPMGFWANATSETPARIAPAKSGKAIE